MTMLVEEPRRCHHEIGHCGGALGEFGRRFVDEGVGLEDRFIGGKKGNRECQKSEDEGGVSATGHRSS
jgi:hypothetical protein